MLNNFLLIAAGLVGFAISYYIWHKKQRRKALYCLVGEDCNTVVNSSYATTFGWRNEVVGMLYYATVALVASLVRLFADLVPMWLISALLALTILGLSFSIYLTAVQAFVLKKWCSWCLTIGVLNIIILIALLADR